MKKSIALIMILVMMTGLCGTVSATGEEPVTQDVWASYTEGTDGRTVISIDISWEQMSFTYAGASSPAWDPEKHRYEGETTEGGWVPGAGLITIQNNSNTILQASIRYEQETAFDSVDMRFTDRNPYIGSAYTEDRTDDAGNPCGTPCRIAVKTIPVGTLSEETGESAKIGTVSVTVDTVADPVAMLDALNERIDLYPPADGTTLERGEVCFATGTDTQHLYALTEAALAACKNEELTEAEKNCAINKALTAFYGALDLAR